MQGGTSRALSAPSPAHDVPLPSPLPPLPCLQEWADSRIASLIRKAFENDKPLAEEVKQLRQDLATAKVRKAGWGAQGYMHAPHHLFSRSHEP